MRVYLDHNSTTPMRAEARARWLEVAQEGLGNPSSLHASGRRARALVDEARARVAAALGVGDEEICFTSGATEANNLALFGALEAAGPRAGLVTCTTGAFLRARTRARAWPRAGGRSRSSRSTRTACRSPPRWPQPPASPRPRSSR
jgi:hypothetical protein